MEDSKPKFSPIEFDDGAKFTSQEVQWVIEDYLNKSEQAIDQRRNSAKYHERMRKGEDAIKHLPVDESPKAKFIRRVQASNDYNWIVAVAKVRNELDPMHSLRVAIYKSNRPGGSTMDIMVKHIDDVLRDTDSSYAERARAKDYIKFISDINKKWTPGTGMPSVEVDFSTATRKVPVGPKNVNTGEQEVVEEVVDIKKVRLTNQKA